MKNFCDTYCQKSLIKVPTCFQNLGKPTYLTDSIIANWPNLFQHRSSFKKGLLDSHRLNVNEFKMGFQKLKIRIVA